MGRKLEKIEGSIKWVREEIERNEFCKDTCIPKAEGGDGGWEFHERELVRLTIILNLLGDLKKIEQKEAMPHMLRHTSYA